MGRATGGELAALARVGLALAMGVALAQCSRAPAPTGAACFPEGARQWLAAGGAAGIVQPAGSDGGQPSSPAGAARESRGLHLLIDGSGSMAGFVVAGQERPLADLLALIPTLEGGVADFRLTRFDRGVTAFPPEMLAQFQRVDGYRCIAGTPCTNQESRIDQALKLVADDGGDTVSVVVTDLWLENRQLLNAGQIEFRRHVQAILASGRSVAVWGFESPYRGRLFDLPSGRSDVSASRRHLFLVAAGPRGRLEAMDRALRREAPAYLVRAFEEGRARHALFTLDPVVAAPGKPDAFPLRAAGSLVPRIFLDAQEGVRIPQFALDRSAALRGDADQPRLPWAGIAPDSVVPGAVWEGPVTGETQIFEQRSRQCTQGNEDWRPAGRLDGGWTGRDFALSPVELASLSPGRYLFVGTLTRAGLDSPNPATQWMREWSFDAEGEAEAIAREVTPTLNLAETARLLEVELQKAAEAKPVPIAGFVAAVLVE